MPTRTRLVIGAFCAVYIAVRLWRLSDSCLWFDEVFSVHAAGHDWSSLFSFVAKDLIHPPLFYVLLKLWISVGGESVFWLRLLPVVFSVLAIFPFVRLCRELKFETPVILLALGLLSINGALIKYTQTLRMYSMLMFLGLLSMWLFARYFNRGKSFIPLVITNVLLIYTHYFGWLVIGTEVAAILIFQRIKWRRVVVMMGILIAAFVPWFIAVWQAARNGSDLAQNIAWQPRPGPRELLAFVVDLVEPFYFQASNAEPVSIYLISIPILAISLAMVVIYFVRWKDEADKQRVYLLLLFIGLPLVVAFAASWLLPHSVWGTRHLMIVLPPAIVIIAHAVMRAPNKILTVSAVTALTVLSLIAFAREARRVRPVYVWCAWDGVAADIRSRNAGEPATIYAFENLVAYHLWFALRGTDGHVAVVKGLDVETDDETYFLPRGFSDVSTATLEEIADDRLWLAFRTSRPDDEGPLIESFGARGYLVCNSFHRSYGATRVFWVELRKARCGSGSRSGQEANSD